MKKEIKYYVIGGQYCFYNHGGAATLEGAKRLATKNSEYWDNWQGWNKPSIYRKEDCSLQENFYGTGMYPTYGMEPIAYWDNDYKKWIVKDWILNKKGGYGI